MIPSVSIQTAEFLAAQLCNKFSFVKVNISGDPRKALLTITNEAELTKPQLRQVEAFMLGVEFGFQAKGMESL